MKTFGLLIGKGNPQGIKKEIDELSKRHIDFGYAIEISSLSFFDNKKLLSQIHDNTKDLIKRIVDEKLFVYIIGDYDKEIIQELKNKLPVGNVSITIPKEIIDFEFPEALGSQVIVSEVFTDVLIDNSGLVINVSKTKPTPKVALVHSVGPQVTNGIKNGDYVIINPMVDTGFTFDGKEYFFISGITDFYMKLPVKA